MSILREGILKTHTQFDELAKEYDRTFIKIFNSLDDVKSYLNIESFYTSDLPNINLAKCLFNFDVELLSVKFNNNITFSQSIFVGKVDFIASEFNADFIEDKSYEKVTPNIFFGVVFLDYSNFEGVKFTNGVCFRCTKFKKWFDLTDAYFGGEVDMRFSSFSGEVHLSYLGRDSKTENSPINISLNESKFLKKVLFYNRIFNNCSFSNTKFQALSDFFNTTFNENVCFDKTDFLGTIVFAEATFHKKAIFLYTQVSRNMILRNTNFLGGVNLALINFIAGGYINSLEVNIKDVEVDGKVLENSYDKLSDNINIRHKRETFRILKHEAIKQNNRIEALKYHGLEMKTYEVELNQINKIEKKKIISILLTIPNFILFILRLFTFDLIKNSNNLSNDMLILSFNRYTNSFGSNWIKSISFTFWIAIFWYIFFLFFVNIDTPLYWSWDNLGETIKYAMQFLNITEWNYKPFGAKYNWAYIPLFVGRIFIGLGVYQTIQAFRKYGRF